MLERGKELGSVGVGRAERDDLVRYLFGQLGRLYLVLLRFDQMELIHEALQAGDELGVSLDVQLGGELPHQALLALAGRTVHDSVLFDAARVDKRLDGGLRSDVVLGTVGGHLSDQEHAILLSHLA